MPKIKGKFRLLPHEIELLASGALKDVTHDKASSKWLITPSAAPRHGRVLCYRHMGDTEFLCLLRTNLLPDTQPYQTLTREEEGRQYCESYLRSNKTVNTNPTTVVEFATSFKYSHWISLISLSSLPVPLYVPFESSLTFCATLPSLASIRLPVAPIIHKIHHGNSILVSVIKDL